MKRTQTSIKVVSKNATTWLPWIEDIAANRCDGYPDFSGFVGQTRQVLEEAWRNFLDSEEEMIIEPDPEPIPETAPDWIGFNGHLLHDEVLKGYRDIARTKDADINAILIDFYSRVQDGGLSEFADIWGMWSGYAELTQSQKDAIATDAELFNLPADFVAVLRG